MCKRTEFVNQMLGDFVKMTLTRVLSHRVTSISLRDWSPVTKTGDSSRVIISSQAIIHAYRTTVPLPSDVANGGQGGEPPTGKLNVKTGPLLVDILIFSLL